jgi:hypothetical protein
MPGRSPSTSWSGASAPTDRAHPGGVRPRPVAAAQQLGPLGEGLRGQRLGGPDPGLARRPETLEEAAEHPEGSPARRSGRSPTTSRPSSVAWTHAGHRRSLLRRAADPDPGRAWPGQGVGGHRPGPVPGDAAPCPSPRSSRRSRCFTTRPTATGRCRSPTSSSATASPTRAARRRPGRVRGLRRGDPREAAVPGGSGQPEPLDRGQGRHNPERGPLLIISGELDHTVPGPRSPTPPSPSSTLHLADYNGHAAAMRSGSAHSTTDATAQDAVSNSPA